MFAKANRAQRLAIKRLFDRDPLYINVDKKVTSQATSAHGTIHNYGPLPYREFRKRVVQGYDCLMIEWCGMWIGIEPDGYTHS